MEAQSIAGYVYKEYKAACLAVLQESGLDGTLKIYFLFIIYNLIFIKNKSPRMWHHILFPKFVAGSEKFLLEKEMEELPSR